MNTIAAREIERGGIGAVDEYLKEGPVQVMRDDRPAYVILSAAQYEALLDAREEAYRTRVEAALEDLRAGRVRRVSARELIDENGLEE